MSAFKVGQTVTGEDIKRALEDGWVIKDCEGDTYWRKDSNSVTRLIGDNEQNIDGVIPHSYPPYTLLRRRDEDKPYTLTPGYMHKPPRTPERPFLPGDMGELRFKLVTPVEEKEHVKLYHELYTDMSNAVSKQEYGILTQGAKMEKPTTPLEKKACTEAIADVVKAEVEEKKRTYANGMQTFITEERLARKHRENADNLKTKLGVTPAQMKEIFG